MTAGEAASVMTLLAAFFDIKSAQLFAVPDPPPCEPSVRKAAQHLRDNAERAYRRSVLDVERIPISRNELTNARFRVLSAGSDGVSGG